MQLLAELGAAVLLFFVGRYSMPSQRIRWLEAW